MTPVYLDHHASTPVDPRARAAMDPFLCTLCGNPASTHEMGKIALDAVEVARAQVAQLVGCLLPEEIVFESGATEANNHALKGTAIPRRQGKRRILVSSVEHKSVLESAGWMKVALGVSVDLLPVDGWGIVDLERAEKLIKPDVLVCSVMLANNEVGSIQPVNELGAMCAKAAVLFHVDATQGVGRIPFSVGRSKADLVSLSAHKIHGPKGVGALYIRKGSEITPFMHGGGQERGMRSGTLNVPGIVGFGEACRILSVEGPQESMRLSALRNRLLKGLYAHLGDRLQVVGPWSTDARELAATRLPQNLNVMIAGIKGNDLVQALKDEICFSTTSACSCAKGKPSHVLKAMGIPDAQSATSVRFGLGRFTTPEEIDYAARRVAESVGG